MMDGTEDGPRLKLNIYVPDGPRHSDTARGASPPAHYL
mgnify:CR=1 FL=1